MKGIINWLTNSFAPAMNKLFSKPWLAAISSCMQKVIPFILTGSVVYLYNVVVSFVPSLPSITPILQYSFGVLGMIISFMMANQCMEKLNHPAYLVNAGITSICMFFMIACPIGDNADKYSAFLTNIGPSGIMVAIITGLYVSLIFHLWSKVKFLEDSAVPDFVAGWLNMIIPNFIILGSGMLLVNVLQINIYSVITSLFAPIQNIGQTLPGFILVCFIPAFFYTMGISSWFFSAITTPIYLAGIQANIDAVAAGGIATNIVTREAVFTLGYITMGGICATLCLNILMLFSKSKQLKLLGKIYIIPSIFNINEPIVYGTVAYNPLLMLPAWINAIVGPIYVWLLMKNGLLNIPSKLIQVGQIPVPFSSVLVTEDMRALLWFAIIFAIQMVTWFPFFKVYEKQKLAEEAKENKIIE